MSLGQVERTRLVGLVKEGVERGLDAPWQVVAKGLVSKTDGQVLTMLAIFYPRLMHQQSYAFEFLLKDEMLTNDEQRESLVAEIIRRGRAYEKREFG